MIEPLTRIIHERFCCNRAIAAATSLHAASAACTKEDTKEDIVVRSCNDTFKVQGFGLLEVAAGRGVLHVQVLRNFSEPLPVPVRRGGLASARRQGLCPDQ